MSIDLKPGVELRAYNFEMRTSLDEKHGHIIEGIPIVYSQRTNIGVFDEIIEAGALTKCNLKDVRFLVNHNTDMIPLARSRNNNENSTMQMSIEADGMHIRVDLDTENNSEAKNLYSAIERGDITGMSFMFAVRGEEWEGLETEHPTRHITDIAQVYEVSAVTFPAYEQTSISARSAETLDNARATLDNARAENEKKQEEERKAEEVKNIKQKLMLLCSCIVFNYIRRKLYE